MRVFLTLTVCASLLCAIVTPVAVRAESDACVCYCGSTSTGAVRQAGTTTSDACIATCQDDNKSAVGCYTSSDQYPENSELCWTKEQCSQKGSTYTWNDNVATCSDKSAAGRMGHCYAPQKSVNLIVPFGGNTAFSNIPTYVSAAYKFIVPVAALLAVVMLMVGGLQYILARGASDAIKKAKTRMVAAITGLVLLMSAYAMASILDPRLVNLKQLRLPAVKDVVILDTSSTCEYLASVGFEIDGKSGDEVADAHIACKTEGEITSIENIASNVVAGSLEKGDTCLYSYCPSGQGCTSEGCAACTGLVDGGAIAPSESTCEEFTSEQNIGEPTGDKYVCSYEDLTGATYTGATVTGPSCAGIDIACTALRSEAGGGSCRSYDTLAFAYGSTTVLALEKLQGEDQTIFQTICTADPCELSRELADGSHEGCMPLSEATGYTVGVASDCVNKGDSPTGTGATGVTGGTCYSRRGEVIACPTR